MRTTANLRKPLLLILVGLFSFTGTIWGQYYYKDIISTRQIGQNFLQYKKNKISRVNVSAFDRNIPVTDAVILQQTINTSENTMVTYTKAPDSDENWLKTRYNDKGELIYTSDSTDEMVTRTNYSYNDKGLLTEINSFTQPKDNPSSSETHHWTYNANGQPEKMVKIKNSADTTYVSFVSDESGNAGEEKSEKKGTLVNKCYYYYDALNHLTDIARFNLKANKILPDYMFEYNEQGQVKKMIVVPEGMAGNYQTWKYEYNPSGLKIKEFCYNKQKELVGKIEYTYQTTN